MAKSETANKALETLRSNLSTIVGNYIASSAKEHSQNMLVATEGKAYENAVSATASVIRQVSVYMDAGVTQKQFLKAVEDYGSYPMAEAVVRKDSALHTQNFKGIGWKILDIFTQSKPEAVLIRNAKNDFVTMVDSEQHNSKFAGLENQPLLIIEPIEKAKTKAHAGHQAAH